MIDLDLYMSLINGGVMLFCLAIGYIIKTSIPKIPNRYIPLIMGIVGMLVFIPLLSVLYTIFREFVYLRLKKQNIKQVTKTEIEEYTEEEDIEETEKSKL